MNHHSTPKLSDTNIEMGDLAPKVTRIAGAVGLLALAGGVAMGAAEGDHFRHFSYSWLVSFALLLSVSLGALIFLPIQFVTRASWSVVIRRLPEVMALALPFMAILILPILLNLEHVYDWASAHPQHIPAELAAHKAPLLNKPFFLIRWTLYFVIWAAMAVFFWRTSRKQDQTKDTGLTLSMENRSGPAILVFALTISFAGMDLLMTLDAAWFSTMFGVYYFAGGFVTFYAVLTLLTMGLQNTGRLKHIISMEHFHDYGKLMFAFTFFWAYIAFSQYMLYWYGNIPEETVFYLVRQNSGWGTVGLVLAIGAFVIPFAGLISRYAKRDRKLLAFWAGWIIVMQYFNLYWIVMPIFSPEAVSLSILDLLCLIAVSGLWLAVVAHLAGKGNLVPVGDPRLDESLHFENA